MNRLPLRDRVQAAADCIHAARRAGHDAATIIATLQRDHAASYRPGAQTNVLRIAGVNASCTWSKTDGLLAAWQRNATVRILQLDGRAA